MPRLMQSESLERKMTKHDWDNLQFLLNASDETLCDWYNKTDTDDHEYASDLFALYHEELKIRSSMLEDEVPDVVQANMILRGYML